MRKFGSITVHGKSNGEEVLGFKKKIAALEQLQRLLKKQVDGNFLEYQIGIGGLKGKVQRKTRNFMRTVDFKFLEF
jgi:hypothetical protein